MKRDDIMNKEKIDNFRGYIDLHLHLDGSLDLDTVKELMKLNNVDNNYSDEELLNKLQVSKENKDLNEYLSKFEFPQTLLQTKSSIECAMHMLCDRLYKEGFIYAEIRFAPQFHTKLGLSQEEVIEAAIRGANMSKLDVSLILCLMRLGNNKNENLETVMLAKKYLGNGIAALDLAGAEGLYPTSDFEEFFKVAKEYNIPFTIHAGEASGADSVKKAISFEASRIGHGVNSFKNEEVLNLAIKNHITYEVCPTSNLNTKVIESVADYHLKNLIDKNVLITINTDNTMVSNTNIRDEFNLLNDSFNLSNDEFKYFLTNSVKSAFIDSKHKDLLLKELNQKFVEINI
jgi:adenosine deaminase